MSARIFEFVTAGEFDDVATKAMCQAFDAAAKQLQDTGQPTIVLEVLAHRIVEAAKRGERDPDHLRDIALAALPQRIHLSE
jgi:hypothetical protein